jgi:hypothetical protein
VPVTGFGGLRFDSENSKQYYSAVYHLILQQRPINMPPRRVLPIRSRVDSNPSEPRADGDGDNNTATPVISAGGSSLGAASAHSQNPDLKSEKSIHVHTSKAGEEGKAAVEANGLKNPGNCPTEQADPKSSETAMHEIMVSTHVLDSNKSVAVLGGCV